MIQSNTIAQVIFLLLVVMATTTALGSRDSAFAQPISNHVRFHAFSSWEYSESVSIPLCQRNPRRKFRASRCNQFARLPEHFLNEEENRRSSFFRILSKYRRAKKTGKKGSFEVSPRTRGDKVIRFFLNRPFWGSVAQLLK